ncbi:hypothetical protein A5886_000372 [Enterococcus sp. 8G7_MSG3316]|uniref:HTH cro/C1-type domain-containing protein n=1 Tax=Candidatus Enterococcus testudinis TaxID=1834191 RepID=A0A242A2X4_9ENTE|nr:helix-turn-helix transcriptional regulator [Enterococcus sp. 8G7_MSG3316]OTN75302.1 hypothetical protein A5886_000372 [Enterococcus sp. 8G7_MSG3316]
MERQLFGKELRRIRKEKKLSQYELADGICSQAMLSSIELGKYLPNVQIIVKLCIRLGLNANQLILNNHYEISPVEKNKEKCEELCNKHDYAELNTFLESKPVLNSIETRLEMQAYYYYLACTQFHLDRDRQESLRSFNLSLAESEKGINSLSLLALMGIATVYAQLGKKESTLYYINKVMFKMKAINYEENLNILFYLKAFAYFNLNMLVDAYTSIEEGIEFITVHNSHYMLGNIFFLASKIAEKAEQENNQRERIQESKMFEKLFNEKIFRYIS